MRKPIWIKIQNFGPASVFLGSDLELYSLFDRISALPLHLY